MKRLLDVLVTLILLIFSCWIFLLIIAAYWLTNSHPIFFKQLRVGKDERIFNLYKFRTLLSDGKTPFALGNFLRATSLDELPQLFQVLTGRLSLVGPRPLPVEYLPLYSTAQRKRHRVLPGITGLAQVSGRNSISWQRKFALDNEYIDHWSLFLDLKILMRTAVIIFSFRPDVSLKESKFTGKE